MRTVRLLPILLCSLLIAPTLRADGEVAATQETVRVPPVKVVHVIVALCDQTQPGMEHVPPSLGNATDPARNLYWGAQFGLKTWFRGQAAWTQVRPREGEIATPHPAILRRVVFFHKDTSIYLVADAYDGTRAREAIRDVLFPRPGDKVEGLVARPIYLGTQANLRAYVGHNALKDNPLQTIPTPRQGTIRPAIFLTPESETTFAPFLEQAELWMLLATRDRIEPEAYTLEAAVLAWAEGGTPADVLDKAAEVYAHHQELEVAAAEILFVHSTPPAPPPAPEENENGDETDDAEDTSPAAVDDPHHTDIPPSQEEGGTDPDDPAKPRTPSAVPVQTPVRESDPVQEPGEADPSGDRTATSHAASGAQPDHAGTEIGKTPSNREADGATRAPSPPAGQGGMVPNTIRALPLPPAYRTADPDGSWTEGELAWRAYILDLPLDPVPRQGTDTPHESNPAPGTDEAAGGIPEEAEAVFGVIRWPPPHRLQQSAGVAIRAYALFLRGRGKPIAFHSMSGDEIAYDKWLVGRYRISEDGARILYEPAAPDEAHREDTDAEFDRYLIFVMTYTNVTSLLRDVPRVPEGAALRWGDLYIQPPGRSHRGQVGFVLQMAVGREDPLSRLYLFGGGGSPARAFSVYRARPGEGYGHWFSLDGFSRRMEGFGEGTFHRFPVDASGD